MDNEENIEKCLDYIKNDPVIKELNRRISQVVELSTNGSYFFDIQNNTLTIAENKDVSKNISDLLEIIDNRIKSIAKDFNVTIKR